MQCLIKHVGLQLGLPASEANSARLFMYMYTVYTCIALSGYKAVPNRI